MNNSKFHKYNNNFFINNKLLIEVPALIKNFLIINDLIILLIDSDELKDDKNIICYNLKGKLIWQIGEVSKLHDRNYFTSIYINKNNELQAYNLNGVEVTINIKNGSIIKKELIK
ncbi:hypothetical protein [Mariniflexile maritimum]|jgi:hypothetical protein|uniref:hypothetical protein n=1 Tax=Mariniflexile maritimum TaxID=2682493 RepID=UPI0012F6D24B|nr:hypothetical protein [Mariniflexile maritimum]